jgi:hypothetical protein
MRPFRARFFFVLALLWGEGALAAPDQQIRVSDCSAELTAQLPGVIGLEIDVLLRERGPTRAPPELIAVRCEAERALISVTLDGASRESSIELGVLAKEHRARAVALAAAELVHSMSNRPPDAKVTPPAPKPSAPAPSSASKQPSRGASSQPGAPRPTLLVGGLAEWLGKPATPLFGARAELLYPLGKLVVPALSVDGALGAFPAESARVSATTISASAQLYFGTSTGSLRWDTGPGARVGWARIAGDPNDDAMLEGRALTAAWGGPEARARVAYGASPLRSPVFALELAAGLVVLPIRGLVDGARRVYAVEGPWLSICAQLGLGL